MEMTFLTTPDGQQPAAALGTQEILWVMRENPGYPRSIGNLIQLEGVISGLSEAWRDARIGV